MNDVVDDARLPLKNVVLCSTSLTQDARARVASMAMEMGGTVNLDLTTVITHLLVANIYTPKYRHVAKERPDIHVLKPEWIEAVRNSWITGEETDVAALTEEYRLPALWNLQICITGFDDMKQRQSLQETINANGGTYHPNLSRSSTHLIAKATEGAKYERAKAWGLKIVSIKWLQDCLERGMVLDESKYNPLIPVEQQGDRFLKALPKTVIGSKRSRDSDTDKVSGQDEQGKRKLRRTASTRLSSHSQNMWADIAEPSVVAKSEGNNQWNEAEDESSKSNPAEKAPEAVKDTRTSDVGVKARPELPESLFTRWACLVFGHKEQMITRIRQLLLDNGAQVVDSLEELNAIAAEAESPETVAHSKRLRTAIVLPRSWTAKDSASMPSAAPSTSRVTEWWLERCIYNKACLDPAEDIFSRPFVHVQPDCFAGMKISTCALGNEIMYISKVLQATGGTYAEDLTRTSSILVCGPGQADPEKPAYAMDRGIPVVTAEWLAQSISNGFRQPIEDFSLPSSLLQSVQELQRSRRRDSEKKDQAQSEDSSRKANDFPRPRAMWVATKRSGAGPPLAPSRSLSAILLSAESKQDEEQPTITSRRVVSPRRRPSPFQEGSPRQGGSPLGDLPVEMNSPRKQDPRSKPDSIADGSEQVTVVPHKVSDLIGGYDGVADDRAGKENQQQQEQDREDSCDTLAPPDREESLKRTLSEFMSRRQEKQGEEQDDSRPKRRKDRKLGRAPSGTSNAVSFTRPTNLEIADSTDSVLPFSGEASLSGRYEAPLPSQQLGYDCEGSEEYRKAMSMKTGTKFEDEGGTRVQSLARVLDQEHGGTGVGGRVRGRHRDAKTK